MRTISGRYRITVLAFLFFWLCFYSLSNGTVGDAVRDCVSVAASGTQAIRPASGDEWALHVLYFQKNVIIQITDGVDTTDISAQAWIGPDHYIFAPVSHVTNSNYFQAVNQDSALASVICWDAIKTKD